MTDRIYPHFGTCDSCAQDDRPLREVDSESEAWICGWCDALNDRGIAAAAETMQVTPAVAAAGIETYFRTTDEDEPVRSTTAEEDR